MTRNASAFAPLDVPDIIRFLHKGMRRVMAGGLGTARKYDIAKDSGKTGTFRLSG